MEDINFRFLISADIAFFSSFFLIGNDLTKFGIFFFNLIKHSLSIISVFRKTVLIRSALFIAVYILLIKSNASILTSMPLLLLLTMIYSISSLALRENMDEFDQALSNIDNIDTAK